MSSATPAEEDAHRILTSNMSLDDMIGQISQIDVGMLLMDDVDGSKCLNPAAVDEWIGQRGVGSVLNLVDDLWTAEQYRHAVREIQLVAQKYNRPPVIYGLDSVHGANYLYGAITTPQPINIGATFNETVAYEAGRLASRDTRAAGITWLFSPLLGISLSPRWSRVYETFGEDPLLSGQLSSAMIRGIQEPDRNPNANPLQAAACAKHFVGYSSPHNGHDRSPSWIPTRHLYQYFVPPWKRAISEANVFTVMESYTETDGVPNVGNRAALRYLLRERLGFTGVLVTDYEEIRNLANWHKVVPNETIADQAAFRQGSVDMSMIPWDADGFIKNIKQALKDRRLSEERIRASASRVVKLKQDLGMFKNNGVPPESDPNLALIGSDVENVLDMVRQSIVLTKNENSVLPIRQGGGRLKVLVTGPTSNSRAYQSGGWTGHWQGNTREGEDNWFTYGSNMLDAFSAESSWDVVYRCGVDVLGNSCDDGSDASESVWDSMVDHVKDWIGVDSNGPESIRRAVEAASSADVVVIGVGEEAYAEKPGDIRSLSLPPSQYDLVRNIRWNTEAKIVLVYFGGRPRILRGMVENVDAVFVGFLPGPSAGGVVVDMMLGKHNPSGRLPLTYPMYDDGGGIPYFRSVSDQCNKGDGLLPHWEYHECEVQWPFGHGLSYTSFEYSDLNVNGGIDRDLEVSVKIRNNGDVEGAETVLFFTFDEFRSTTPEYKRLRAFDKVHLDVGAEKTIHKIIPLDEMKFIGPDDDTHYIIDPSMTSWVGVGTTTDCRVNPEDNALCARISSDSPERVYIPACEAACDLWVQSGCNSDFGLSREKCTEMCTFIADNPGGVIEDGNEGWGWNYVRCIETVVWGMKTSGADCSKMTSLCRNILTTEGANEYGVGGKTVLPTASSIPTQNFVALLVGLVSTAIVVLLIRGYTAISRIAASETEFSAVNTEEDTNVS